MYNFIIHINVNSCLSSESIEVGDGEKVDKTF